ncbi:MAG: DUF5706 domain-containing protein [Woeseiaceae bacterium]
MSDDKERLLSAQWILERNLSWIMAAEVKVGVIVAVDSALLGSLGASFSSSSAFICTSWTCLWLVCSGAAIIAGLFCAAMAVLPRLEGPESSLIYFGRVAALDRPDYINQLKRATDMELLDDLSAQVHQNALIACKKFAWVRLSMYCSFFSITPWFASIVTLLQK